MSVDVSTLKIVTFFRNLDTPLHWISNNIHKVCLNTYRMHTNLKCNSQNNIAKHFKVQSTSKIGKRLKMLYKLVPRSALLTTNLGPLVRTYAGHHTQSLMNKSYTSTTNTSGIDIKSCIFLNLSILVPFP